MKEAWKDVKGCEGRYKVSNEGRVKRLAQDDKKEEILKPHLNHKGYEIVGIKTNNGLSKQVSVHRLVATAFIKNPNNFPQVNHKDEVKTNNRVDNLEWCTCKYNVNYGTRNQRAGESNRCCPTTSK